MATPTKSRAATVTADPRWASIVARDAAADGSFVYGVRSTGVYCRPSCPARRARPENVEFHGTAAEAERAGFRPCRRCRPDQLPRTAQQAALVAELCRLIDGAEQAPSLADLARHAGMSSFHVHRLFKAITGVTPKAYADARRAARLRDALDAGAGVTDAIYGAGFNSGSRYYEQSHRLLGMTAGNYRAGGSGERIRFAVGECSLGSILVASSERGVCAILLGDDPQALARALQDRFPRADLHGGDAAFERLVAQVVGFVEAPRLGLNLPLDLRGTLFQQRVWQALQTIPPGATLSYSELARRIGAPKSIRAVAAACAANTLAVAIPCHRVLRNDGALAGYRWGVTRKRALLEREAQS